MEINEELDAMEKRPVTEDEREEFLEAYNAERLRIEDDPAWLAYQLYDLGVSRGIRKERERRHRGALTS